MLANLAAETSAYADLPDCSQRTEHTIHADSTGHDQAGTDGTDTTITTSTDDACCGTCDHCSSYFDAHLQGLTLAMDCVVPPAPHMDISGSQVHAIDFNSRPNLPPPRLALVLRLLTTV